LIEIRTSIYFVEIDLVLHLFGNILTHYGPAANNRGKNEGNITPLQKLEWKGDVHTTVSAEAIRWALRYSWQQAGYTVNRCWNDETNQFSPVDMNFDANKFIDDDVLGFMRTEAAKVENLDGSTEVTEEDADESSDAKVASSRKTSKKKRQPPPKGIVLNRRGALEVSRAVSMTPFSGDITFNAVSGEKNRTSLYATEIHATRYQYGFALTPNQLKTKSHIFAVLDGLISCKDSGVYAAKGVSSSTEV